MSDPTGFRQERIERLLRELQYEIERGMMEREIDETISFEFYVPVSQQLKDGVVRCMFQTRPVHRVNMPINAIEPILRLVKS